MVKRINCFSEISGEGFDINKALKKTKNAFEEGGKQITKGVKKGTKEIEKFGNKAVKQTGEYVDVLLHGRNDYPPNVRQLINEYGNKVISSIIADRTPVVGAITGALNVVSFGAFNKRLDRSPYDKLFHLRIDITFTDGSRIAVEKNEVINMYRHPKKLKGGEQQPISNVTSGITLNELLEGGKRILGNKFFRYSASSNNCQDFIIALLKGSNIGSSEDYSFIKQNTSSLFKNDPFLRKLSNSVTDLGGKVNEITTGAGLGDGKGITQSVLFSKPEWTKRRAINWLKKHDYSGLDCDEKEEHYRFRQVEPSKLKKNKHLITKSIGKNIELIIAYKNKPRSKSINMGKKYYSSDSESSSSDSDSDSDSEMGGSGFDSEQQILRKIKQLKGDIHEHQKMHGGKINIVKAVKKVGRTVRRGFDEVPYSREAVKIATPYVNRGIKEASPYVNRGIKEASPYVNRAIKETTPYVKSGIKTATKLGNRTASYTTRKKGGLASDLLHKGVPLVTGTLAGAAAEALFPEAGPVSGFLGEQAGSYAGEQLADYVGHKTGVGFKRPRGRPRKTLDGSGLHIDIGSHNIKKELSGGALRRAKNSSLEQLINSHRDREGKELMDAMKIYYKNRNKEVGGILKEKPLPRGAQKIGAGLKGSAEAKEKMARIRAMKRK